MVLSFSFSFCCPRDKVWLFVIKPPDITNRHVVLPIRITLANGWIRHTGVITNIDLTIYQFPINPPAPLNNTHQSKHTEIYLPWTIFNDCLSLSLTLFTGAAKEEMRNKIPNIKNKITTQFQFQYFHSLSTTVPLPWSSLVYVISISLSLSSSSSSSPWWVS